MHVAWGWVFAPVWVLEACISYHALYHIIKKIVNSEESKFKAVGNVTSLAIKRVFRLEIGNTIKPEEVRKIPLIIFQNFYKISVCDGNVESYMRWPLCDVRSFIISPITKLRPRSAKSKIL